MGVYTYLRSIQRAQGKHTSSLCIFSSPLPIPIVDPEERRRREKKKVQQTNLI